MSILKKGDSGELVKILQRFLGINDDGVFGKNTENAVIAFQKNNRLKPDGIVGKKTWEVLEIASTDLSEDVIKTENGLVIKPNFLDADEYHNTKTKKEYVFLHHTAGWDNPYNTIHGWNVDNRGRIGTEFVIGGQGIQNNSNKYDGHVLQAIPAGYYAMHLGTVGSQYMHTNSIGIELCNFGELTDGKTWTGAKAHTDQILTLKESFRGFNAFQKYSDEQLISCKKLIYYIAKRDNIDICDGLPALVKKNGAKAFEFNSDAYYGRIKGLWTHTNVRKDKRDCFPQPELLDMLRDL